MKNPTFPDNENEIPSIFFKTIKKNTPHTLCITKRRVLTTPLFSPLGFSDILKKCGVEYIG